MMRRSASSHQWPADHRGGTCHARMRDQQRARSVGQSVGSGGSTRSRAVAGTDRHDKRGQNLSTGRPVIGVAELSRRSNPLNT
jgi:hypothetical protein